MIIGTAGHVDHGKTALVRALTGVDTDRLAEEKARGISITLGYAYQGTPDGHVLGYVDVPGHERFVHTMLAGATGIDFALLAVAADDGVMPQTVEHLQILDLLGVRRGAVALTKVDRVDAQRVVEQAGAVRALLHGTGLAGSPVFPVSAVTGAGMTALRAHLDAGAGVAVAARRAGNFRLAVDRSFTLDGLGTVATGTVHAGTVRVGDHLVVTPAGIATRVRSIHAQGRSALAASAGDRCALNLTGVAKDSVARGDWLVAQALHAPTARIDVRLRLLPGCAPLTAWTPVHLHLGAAHRTGHALPLDGDRLEPGGEALAQIVLDRPMGALHADRFILRDAGAARTIGGGVVVDPFAPARHRRTARRLAVLQALADAGTDDALDRWLALEPHGGDLVQFCRARNLVPAALAVPDGVRVVESAGERRAFTRSHWNALQARVLEGLADFHGRHPDEQGPDRGRLRRMLLPQLTPAAAAGLIDDLLASGQLRRSGPWLHLPAHDLALGPAERQLADRALPLIAAGGFDPPWVRAIAGTLDADEAAVRGVLLRLTRRAEVFQVVRDLFFAPAASAARAAIAGSLEARDGAVRAAAFRDGSGIGRKRAVQVLEFFDRVGFTRRVRDWHRVRGDSLALLAPAGERADRAEPQ